MNIRDLQERLKASGRYAGAIDGDYGPASRAAVLQAMTDGPDTQLSGADFAASAARLGVTVGKIRAVTEVESSGAGFAKGRPVLLFEPHRFSRATQHRFDTAAPDVSYRTWDRARYPKSQDGRYEQLVKAVGLDVDAGFASASYGRFQILGENFKACGYADAFAFAEAQAFDEATQLKAFEAFVTANGLADELRRGDWAGFARGYNGTAYAVNKYDTRLAAAAAKWGG